VYIHCMNKSRAPRTQRKPNATEAGQSASTTAVGVDFGALVMQDTRVFKAGNSLAIRIPSAIAKRIALEDGSEVEMAVDDGMIYVRKSPSRALSDLVDRITPENRHEPIFDDVLGAERW
jgi:antitoxin MazE